MRERFMEFMNRELGPNTVSAVGRIEQSHQFQPSSGDLSNKALTASKKIAFLKASSHIS